MNCKVNIDGGAGKFASFGELSQTPQGFRLEYCIDGDDCRLWREGGKIFQTRRGSLNLTLEFEEGENTGGSLASEGLCGNLEIFTRNVALTERKNGINLKMEYTCCGEEFFTSVTAVRFEKR